MDKITEIGCKHGYPAEWKRHCRECELDEERAEFRAEIERVTQERDEARNSCSVIESFWLAKQEENQRLQQERDEIKKYHDIGFANFRSVLAERDTAIEALRWYANPPEDEMGEHARRTLKELGVIE